MFDLTQHPDLWRADALAPPRCERMTSGYGKLDDALGGGWPVPALIEILTDVYGIGEMRLIAALVKGLSHRTDSGLVCWINPPFQPNAVALAQQGLMNSQHWITRESLSGPDALWCLEQSVRSRACSVAVAWIPSATMAQLRRVKLAITQSQTPAVIYRPTTECAQSSPAPIRLRLVADGVLLRVTVLKAPGRMGGELQLPMESPQLSWSAA
jgi:hypothetical protein